MFWPTGLRGHDYLCSHESILAGHYSPKKSQKVKYCSNVKGGYTSESFKSYRLPTSIVTSLVKASNQSLALSTWNSYKTVENHIKRCEADTKIRMRFPMDDRDLQY